MRVCVCKRYWDRQVDKRGEPRGPGQQCDWKRRKETEWGCGGRGPGSIKGPRSKGGVGKMEKYLHQLSARLLGWSRSCEPPAIELVLPAEDITSHSVIVGAPPCWPEGQ